MKKMSKFASVAVVVTIAVMVVYQGVMAKTKSWQGSVGGVSVRAEKSIYLNAYTWSSALNSSAAQVINVIGYTYWTLAEYCPKDGTYAYWHQYGGGINRYDDYYYTGAVIYYRGCNGVSRHKSLGNHDFGANGEHIYPYVKVTVNRY